MTIALTAPRSTDRRARATARALFERKLLAGSLMIGALLAAGVSVHAQGIGDPTRPAIADIATSPGTASDAGAPAVPTLQTVIISPTERAAIINGERVKLGSTYAGSRVVKITENEVVLRSNYGTETLRMYPDVTIVPARAASLKKKPVRKSARGDRS